MHRFDQPDHPWSSPGCCPPEPDHHPTWLDHGWLDQDEECAARGRPPLERLVHLVLVDGRLVDTWSEPVQGTRWQEQADRADRLDRERARAAEPPAPPLHERVLSWLRAVVGGEAALAALDDHRLVDDGADLPEVVSPAHRERLTDCADLLDAAAADCFTPETAVALRTALLRLWAIDPDWVVGARSAAHVAGGICWAVGKANGLLGAQGVTQSDVQSAVGLTKALSSTGPGVQRLLQGYLTWDASRPYAAAVPDLLPLGHADLLLSRTRRTLVRARDRALEARAALDPDAVLP